MSIVIKNDIECGNCRYNLRGLNYEGKCPECGTPVSESARLIFGPKLPLSEQQRNLHNMRAKAMRDAAVTSPYPVAAFSFVRKVLAYARLRQTKGAEAQHVTGMDVCDAVREYAPLRFGSESTALLRLAELRIHRSEDVGAIIFAMVRCGVIEASASDSMTEFAGRFTLADLFST